jgi:hypothetical protein
MDHLREASVYAGLGQNGKAEAVLGEGFARLGVSGAFMMKSYIEIDPNFDGLRRRPVLAKMNFRKSAP